MPVKGAGRQRLRTIHEASISELKDGLAPELVEELERLSLPFSEEVTPSEAELRIAQAQLVGWLEGLFHGIQATLFAQQMTARNQLEEMRRRALPGRPGPVFRSATISPTPTKKIAIEIICAIVNMPKKRSSLARKNSTMKRSTPASTQ